VAKIKVAYNLILTGILVVCTTYPCQASFGSDAGTKIGLVFMYIDNFKISKLEKVATA